MKVLILCAGEPDFFNAFVKTRIKTGVSLVENQISSLLLLGVNAAEIYVVLDNESIKNQEIASRENSFGINFKFARNFRFRSANTFINVLNNLNINSDLLILNGDTFFTF